MDNISKYEEEWNKNGGKRIEEDLYWWVFKGEIWAGNLVADVLKSAQECAVEKIEDEKKALYFLVKAMNAEAEAKAKEAATAKVAAKAAPEEAAAAKAEAKAAAEEAAAAKFAYEVAADFVGTLFKSQGCALLEAAEATNID